MKKIFAVILVIFILVSCSLVKKFTNNGGLNIKSYVESQFMNKNSKGTLVAKIDEIPITLQQVRDEMEYSLSLDYNEEQVKKIIGDPELKKNYEDKIINQCLIMKKMMKDKDFDKEEFKKHIDISLKEAFVKYYMYKSFFEKEENKKWKDFMATTDDEVLKFYSENKKFFDDKKVKQEDALYAIKTDLDQRKNALFMSELVKFQNNLMDQLKTEYKVERISN